MKALFTTLAILAACTFTAGTTFAADATPSALAAYNLPTGTNLKLGHIVRPVFSEAFQKCLQDMIAKLGTLPKEKQKAVVATLDATELPVFDADLWDQDTYNSYKAGFQETQVQPVANAAIGLQPLENDEWRLLALVVGQDKKQAPLSIGALRYNAKSNVWTSNNGELQATPFTGSTDSIYGTQNGTEWKLVKEDDISGITETLRFTKTTDGKFVYITYQFRESSAISGSIIAQDGYTLRLPITAISASIGNQTKH